MTPETQQRATQFVFTAGLVGALLVALPGLVTGFGIGWSTAAARSSAGSVHVGGSSPPTTPVAWPSPVPLSSPEPDYLNDVEALLGIQPRIRESGHITGRYKFLSISADRTLVAQVEIEGMGLDSVVFSWGQTVRSPIAMDAEDREALPEQLFTLTDAQLSGLPAIVDRVVQQHPTGTDVESVSIHALLGSPRMELSLTHPREVLDSITLDLNGRPLPPR